MLTSSFLILVIWVLYFLSLPSYKALSILFTFFKELIFGFVFQAQGWALIALNQSNLENCLLPLISVGNEMKTSYSRLKTINVWHYSDKTQDFYLIIMSYLLKKKECRSLLVATSNHLLTMKKISKKMTSTRRKESHMDSNMKKNVGENNSKTK